MTVVGVVDVLAAVRDGSPTDAASLADAAAGADPDARLPAALRRALEPSGRRGPRAVYAEPEAFRAFIDGGGNVALYHAVGRSLADLYVDTATRSVLDVGTGDGRAVLTALSTRSSPVTSVTAVEPSEELADAARRAFLDLTIAAEVITEPIESYLPRRPHKRWDLAQATFALHALEPSVRVEVLARLRDVTGAVAVVEFGVPAFDDRSDEHVAYLADRYERGLAEYDDELVADGFLLPVLLGQLDPDRPRATWEQPPEAWVAQLEVAGFTDVSVEPVADYWWAPAVLISGS